MGRRSGRAAAKRATAALESTPKKSASVEYDEDEPMPDVDDEEPEQAGDDDDVENENDEDDDDDDDDEGEVGGSAAGEEAPEEEEASGKSPTPAPEPVIRRRRLGRPPKNRPPDWDTLPIERPERDPDAPPRRRGRGGWRGRGGRKGQIQQQNHQIIDKEGTSVDIVNDELLLPEDPEGEAKVDKHGHLQGGREYRCRTFTIAGRGERLYMLSTEPARCVGFRDSYLFFNKHKKLYKIILGDEEKKDLIERSIIPHSYKGRTIGVVTARSVFREFGSVIVVGGRRITDDYEVAKAKEEGVVEGEVADPLDAHNGEKPYNKNQYVAWHGASAVYHSGGPSMSQTNAKVGDLKKKRVAVDDVNWQLEHAREASYFNSALTAARRTHLNGVYDVHTNTMLKPSIMQPTHARIEQVVDSKTSPADNNFPPLKPLVSRNFLVTDMHLETPATGLTSSSYDARFRTSTSDRVLASNEDFLAPFRGLAAISDEIKDLLPPECRTALDTAISNEKEWSSKWGDEADNTCRRPPVVDKAIVPYSMNIG